VAARPDGPTALPPQFYRRTYLFILTVLTGVYAVVAVVFPTPWVEVPLGLLTLLFVPGYALGALTFGAQPRWPWSLTFALTVGLSVAFNVAVGLVLLEFNLGLPAPVFAFVALILLMGATLAWVAKQPAESGSRFTAVVAEELRLPGHSSAQRAVGYALVVGIVLVLVLIIYFASIFPAPTPNLSLALVGPGGTVNNLTRNGTIGNLSSGPTYIIDVLVNDSTAQTLNLTLNASPNGNATAFTKGPPLTSLLDLAGPTTSSVRLVIGANGTAFQKVHFFFTAPVPVGTAVIHWVLTFVLSGAGGKALRSASWEMTISRPA